MRFLHVWIILFLGVSSMCAQTVAVDLSHDLQTMSANGINFEGYHTSGGNEILADKFDNMLNGLQGDLLRIGLPLKEWEPNNDNTNAAEPSLDNFSYSVKNINSFKRLEELDSRGYALWLAIWDAPNWMVKDASKSHKREIKDFDEFLEAVCAYLLVARDEYGVEPMYVSVNEPSIATENGWGGYQLTLSRDEQAEMIKKGAALFAQHGLTTKWLVAVHKVYASELAYAKSLFDDDAVRPHIGGFDFHGYWFQSGHDDDMQNWGDWIATTGLPAFAGECDYDNQFWQRDDRHLWKHAIETATLLHKTYNFAHASGTLCWYGDSPSSSRPYRYVNKHFYDYLAPNAIFVGTQSSTSGVYATAAKHELNDEFTLVITNTRSATIQVSLNGLPDCELEWIASWDGNYFESVGTINGSESPSINLPPKSISTIYAKNAGISTDTLDSSESPQGFQLYQNYPNPFNPGTRIDYQLPETARVNVSIYNSIGQKVWGDEIAQSAGHHHYLWDGTDENTSRLGAGVYFYQLDAVGASYSFTQIKKMLIIK